MIVLPKFIAFLFCVATSDCFSLLRHSAGKFDAEPRGERRVLQGQTAAIIDGKAVSSTSYNGYSANEVPVGGTSPQGDAADYLRNGDQCLKGGTISRSNCGAVPNCSFNGQFGPAKLCINRLPTSSGVWYVAAMKCIPQWENCDKCMCGIISSEGADATCTFDGQTPDDDSTSVNCSQLGSAKIDGVSFSVGSSGSSKASTSTNKSNPSSNTGSGTTDGTAVSTGSNSHSPPAPAQLNTLKQESEAKTKSILFASLGLVVAVSLLAFVVVKIVRRRKMKSSTKEAPSDLRQGNSGTSIDESLDKEREGLDLTKEGETEV